MNAEINSESPAKNAEKKRILFIITQSELGGAQQFLVRLIGELDQRQFLLTIVAGSDGSHEIKKMLPSGVSYLAARHLRRNPSPVSDTRAVLELRGIIQESRPDIVFLGSSKAGFVGSLAARLAWGVRPVIIYRIGGWTFNDPWPAWKRILYRWMEKLSAFLKDYIILNNQSDLDQARRYGIRPRKDLLLIHNGIDPFLDFLPKEEARLKLFDHVARQYVDHNKGGQARLFHAERVIGTIANFYPAKGLSFLIDAMARLDEKTVCIIIGDGVLRPELQARVAELKLEHKVFFAGKVASAHRYLSALDVFILSSIKEGFPWAVLEAMAAKVPVVATRVGAVPEVIESGKNGTLVEPGNPRQIAEATAALLGNDRLRQEYAIAGHQTVLHRFNLRGMVEAYEKLFLRF